MGKGKLSVNDLTIQTDDKTISPGKSELDNTGTVAYNVEESQTIKRIKRKDVDGDSRAAGESRSEPGKVRARRR